MSQGPIRLDASELFAPHVDAFLEERAPLGDDRFDAPPVSRGRRLLFNPIFFLSVAGLAGGLAGFALIEPFFDENELVAQVMRREVPWIAVIMFPTVSAFVGLFIGMAEGLVGRNPLRAFVSGIGSLAIGFVASLLLLIPASILIGMAGAALQNLINPNKFPAVVAGDMVQRGLAWAIIAIGAGIGQGVMAGSWKVTLNGLIGGMIGGLLGGLLFVPIVLALDGANDPTVGGTASRGVGFALVGLFVGFFIGLVEQIAKTAWVEMLAGPLAGKQFVLHRDSSVVGSSPKADIYLFKDAAIEPRHATIRRAGNQFILEAASDAREPVTVNGQQVASRLLRPGDVVGLGKTQFRFGLREAK